MNIKKTILLLVLFLVYPSMLLSQGVVFERNLFQGTKGEDVRVLQRLLNADAETLVASSGAGSPGNETDYFGQATKRALIRFQEKYRKDILTPLGLNAGSGYFGAKSREKISALRAQTQTVAVNVASTTVLKETPKIPVLDGKVYVMFPSQYSGKHGTVLTLAGAGFTDTDNTIYFGANHAVVAASSVGGQSISFKVPNIPKGVYSLMVKNARGESNKDQWFIVTDGVSPEPKIEIMEPSVASRGDVVTINGSGFLAEKNTIMVSGVGLFEKVSSPDGVSLSFTIPKSAFPVKFSPLVVAPSVSLSVRVVNENGLSNYGKVELKL